MGYGIIITCLIFFVTYTFFNVTSYSSDDMYEEELNQKQVDNLPINESPVVEDVEQSLEDVEDSKKIPSDTILFVKINIPPDISASEISQILFENYLIDESTKFSNYLIDLEIDRVINQGTFYIPIECSYDDIIDIIKKPMP